MVERELPKLLTWVRFPSPAIFVSDTVRGGRDMTRHHRYFFYLLILIKCFSGCVYAATNDIATKVTWGYKGNIGPERWAQLDPGFSLCVLGDHQSPINILKRVQATTHALQVHYRLAPLMITRDGTTDLMIGHQQTIVRDGQGIQVDFHQSKQPMFIMLAGKQYDLVQLHFHSPSENQLQGQSFPLEVHFVHQGEQGTIVIIGVLVRGGEANPALEKIIAHLPSDRGQEHVVNGENMHPGVFLPTNRDYYDFVGSLTTPPCTEGIQWLVMANAITASPSQIARLRQAIGGANARPVKSLHQRAVSYAMEKQA
jgi:carbonic anhydrase